MLMPQLKNSSARLIKTTLCLSRNLNASAALASNKHYDIVIAGGGLVGVGLAASLAKNETLSDKSILLLEGAPTFKPQSRETYSNRVSAINKQSIRLLKSIGAWDFISESGRVKPVLQMQVWDGISGEAICFNHPQFAESVASIVENDLMLQGMYAQIENLTNVDIKNESRLASCLLPKDSGASQDEIVLKSGEKFTCDLLVGADGFNSLVRQSMGIQNLALSYKQMGVVATLELNEEHAAGNSVAWQRFLPTGPVALLPLTDTLSSLVWTTNVEHAKELLKMSPTDFVDALNEAFMRKHKQNTVVEGIMKIVDNVLPFNKNKMQQMPPQVLKVQDNSRAAFPLGFGHASSYVCKGAAVIGDAAHRVHPLAGQGVNLGFGDVLKLTEVLAEAIFNGSELSDLQYLLKYEQERLRANVPIMAGVHALQTLYCNDFPPFVLARSLGLKFTSLTPPIKKFFMEKAIA